jgi:Na+(H+)/acetate symporter ActP
MDCLNSTNTDYYQIIQTVVLITAVFVATLSIWWSRKTSKQQNTIKLLMQDINNDVIKNGIRTLLERDKNDIANFDNNSIVAMEVRNLLNYCEMLSIGVNNGIYDFKMIKKAQKTMITKIYEHSKPYIDKRRADTNNNNFYKEFEFFVKKLNK